MPGKSFWEDHTVVEIRYMAHSPDTVPGNVLLFLLWKLHSEDEGFRTFKASRIT